VNHVFILLFLIALMIGAFWGARKMEFRNSGQYLPTMRRRGDLTERRAIKIIYRHVDESLGVREVLRDERAKKNMRMRLFTPRRFHELVDFWFPRSWAGVPLPNFKRQHKHVVEAADIRPYRGTEHMVPHRITLEWTSEAPTNTEKWLEDLTRGRRRRGGGLAQALGLEWHSDLFDVRWNRPEAQITFILLDEIHAPRHEGSPLPVAMPEYPLPPTYAGNGQPRRPAERGDPIS
jgi:hypothetical protein